MKPFVRVKSRITGHQFDIHRSRFDPEKHIRIARVPDAWAPRRPKRNILKTSPRRGEGDRPTD